MEATELIMLYDYYGDLLTERQRECFDLRYNQDMSLGEIGEELGISRQGVYDNLSRAEALLRNMEVKTGCVARDLQYRKTINTILRAVSTLDKHSDPKVWEAVLQIKRAARDFEE